MVMSGELNHLEIVTTSAGTKDMWKFTVEKFTRRGTFKLLMAVAIFFEVKINLVKVKMRRDGDSSRAKRIWFNWTAAVKRVLSHVSHYSRVVSA